MKIEKSNKQLKFIHNSYETIFIDEESFIINLKKLKNKLTYEIILLDGYKQSNLKLIFSKVKNNYYVVHISYVDSKMLTNVVTFETKFYLKIIDNEVFGETKE